MWASGLGLRVCMECGTCSDRLFNAEFNGVKIDSKFGRWLGLYRFKVGGPRSDFWCELGSRPDVIPS